MTMLESIAQEDGGPGLLPSCVGQHPRLPMPWPSVRIIREKTNPPIVLLEWLLRLEASISGLLFSTAWKFVI